jgi:small-conductance mechanosensitive channel
MPGDASALPLILAVVLGLAGIVVWHLQGSGRPTARLVVQIVFFAAMSLTLWQGGVALYRPAAITAGDGPAAFLTPTALVLWWTHCAWTVIGILHIYIRLTHKPREAHLILDLAVAVIYGGALLSILGFVFGLPVATLVTTSGVVAVILGLALQNTLGDVFSGMALTLGKAFVLGDWIQLADGTAGRVIETNWRSTNLLNGDNNLVVLPNSLLAKQSLTSLSRPDETHQVTLSLRFAAGQRPRDIEEAMHAVLRDCTRIVSDPPPVVALKGMDALAIDLELLFRVASVTIQTAARNELIDLVDEHCMARGLSFSMPGGTVLVTSPARRSHR